MKSGDFIYIDFIGRIKDTGEIFDLTNEEIAKKENIYNPSRKYKPMLVIIDGGFVTKGLNKALKNMEVGERKTVEIFPEEGFGERRSELIKLIPLSSFNDQNVEVVPGSFVNVNGVRGKIISVAGGRVKIDFNHPLAGKTLEYEIEIKSCITNLGEKVYGIVDYFLNLEKEDVDIKVVNNEAQITVKKEMDIPRNVKQVAADTILKWVKEIQRIKFIEVFEKVS